MNQQKPWWINLVSTRPTSGGNNQQALLDTIAYAEGTSGPEGYNTWFGGRNDMDLSKMTVNEVVQEQKRRLASGEAHLWSIY